MKAKEARELSKNAAKEEIKTIEDIIETECLKCNTRIQLQMSAAAYAYFLDNGYELTTISGMGNEFNVVTVNW
jgi:predicted nucleic acid-binding Zn ribbon protein